MEIHFKDSKTERIFNSQKELNRKYGENAKKIQMRMQVLAQAINLEEVPSQPPDRRHQLSGDLEGKFAVDLKHPFRLIFEPSCPLEFLEDGGINLKKVTAVRILEVRDYH
ncbi:type II toxin-antitoxin system RelE/ParE family toxin [Leptospira bandrabouensis]|uniref:type II toxin-antitoxin system RelE/ParE family toxin n=1 Tax=Leptospira bandrabouensis TaxID=2484903 RepID=UPI001EEBE6A8|nr:type II toxin-antitoxin system RelE/ParE family toxin [Leptospira bandrabouensis]MCG6146138.1 type II toxin-antitoxin system RelE/ParE family toxin [Leptospira bandrabouensis]MCG6165725.1 type II toxin-antitoxin system RelE/ParE family toxin [Leptospira bandrabouensis]